MVNFLKGEIFSTEFNEKDNEVFGAKIKRMVIVVKQNPFSEYVYVVPLSAYKGKSNNYKFRLIAEIPIMNGNIKTVIRCDELTKIHISKFHERIGRVDNNTIDLINNAISKFLGFEKKSDFSNIQNESQEKNIQITQIEITNPQLFKEILEKVDYIKGEVEIANKPINKWKERIIGFLLGIMASIIASIIIA